jgi:hypothetical protein
MTPSSPCSRKLFHFIDLRVMDRTLSFSRSVQQLLHPNLGQLMVTRIQFFLSRRELFVIARTDIKRTHRGVGVLLTE